jgi:bifunctional UDP-N-acetylglucosamine pyrophosphorylase/glucosamine-1-phosphate N-acetyltransferase
MSNYTITDPATAYISPEAKIGAGTVIKPNTTIEGAVEIGANCVIGPNSIITDSIIHDNVSILMSVVKRAVVGSGSEIGPFAHLRPGTKIGKNVRIGNFTEVKQSEIGNGSKASHLSYIGDSVVGENVNFGCGCVTANYDGEVKQTCTIEDGAFIGCNTNLIAPVTVGKNSYTAAGSTITQDVPENSLAVARSKQKNILNWIIKKRKNQ